MFGSESVLKKLYKITILGVHSISRKTIEVAKENKPKKNQQILVEL